MSDHEGRQRLKAGVVLAALGVVFGDIGTSPIYTLQTVFNPEDPHPVALSRESLFGVSSLVLWSVMLIVTLTYVLLAMRVDNEGEGGIMALITLLSRRSVGRAASVLALLGVFGAALFFGDSMITPAISVLSAVEGLKVVEPSFEEAVVPVTAVILVLLFLVQRRGTAAVGRVFGPVMVLWFATIGVLGVRGIAQHPTILQAVSPTYAVSFVAEHPSSAFFALAAIVLSVTGAEALYADMGHFGRRAITLGWLGLVLPACALSYLGQAALLLGDPGKVSSPFFLLVPDWGRLPLVLLATAATVIASQAVISGAYSVASQAAELGYLPRLRIAHTSDEQVGQVYVPWVNWFLMLSVLLLVFSFRSSAALAYAFGMAVTGTIAITTLLLFVVARDTWRVPRWVLWGGAGLLLTVDLSFFAANLTKLVHGAWLPLLIGVLAFTVMTTWQQGRRVVTAARAEKEGPLLEFVQRLARHEMPTTTVPGTAVFLNRGSATAPLALRANVEHNLIRHEKVVIVGVETLPLPRVHPDQRWSVDPLGDDHDGITHIVLRFGYTETPDVPGTLRMIPAEQTEGLLDLDDASYFLSKIELRAGRRTTMPRWRTRLFLATSHLTADAAEHFRLPRDRTVIMGAHIDV